MQKEEVINLAYRSIIKELSLLPEHLEELLNRGLSLEQIREKQYKSFIGSDEERVKLGKVIQNAVGNSAVMVPGIFHGRNENGESMLMLNTTPGLIIPNCDQYGQIHCLRIRVQHKDSKNYLYMSSSKMNGPKVSTDLHFSKKYEGEQTVWLTEGSLKADIASILSGKYFVAVQSVTTLKPISKLIDLGVEKVIVAFDMDFNKKPQVARGLAKVVRELKRKELEVCVATW